MLDCAEGRNRTGTGPKPRQILSLLRLPIPPPRQNRSQQKKPPAKRSTVIVGGQLP